MDLNGLIGTQPAEADDVSTDQALDALLTNFLQLTTAFETIDRAVGILQTQFDVLNKHVAYLLTKDPVVGPKIIAAANAKEEEAK